MDRQSAVNGSNRPSLAVSAAIFIVAVGLMAWLRLWFFRGQVVTLTYALPLLLCVWHRDRRLLWSMAAAFAAMASYKAFFLLPQTGHFQLSQWLMQIVNIAIVAATVDQVVALTTRLHRRNNELQLANCELQTQAEELQTQSEELQQQSEELEQQYEQLQQQSEEMEQQQEEIQSQNEDLRTLNDELTQRESVLNLLLESASSTQSEHAFIQTLSQRIIDLHRGRAAGSAVVERSGDDLVLRGHAGVTDIRNRWPLQNSFAAIVMAQDKTAFIEDLETRPDLIVPHSLGRPFRSILATPLQVNGQCVGALEVYAESPQQWTTSDFMLIEWIATQCSHLLLTIRLKNAVAETAQQHKLALEAGRLGVWDYDLQAGTVYWDERFMSIFGVRDRQLAYEDVIALIHPDDRERVDEAVARATDPATAEPYDIEYRVIWPDSCEHWIAAKGQAHFEGDGPERHCARFVGTVMDITYRKRAEYALRASVRRFELLAHTAGELLRTREPQAIVEALCRNVMELIDCQAFFSFLVDEQANGLRLNAYAGVPSDTAETIRFLEYGTAVCGCAARDACRIVSVSIQENSDPRTEFVKSLGIRAYACQPLMGSAGKVLGTVSFGTTKRDTFSESDLSLIAAVADHVSVAMIRMKGEQELMAANNAKDQFIAVLSHELRTPLTPVLTAAEMLATDTLSSQQTELVEMIRRNVELEARLIDDLLDLTRIARGKLDLTFQRVDLHQKTHQVLEMCRQEINDKQLRLVTRLQACKHYVLGDSARLQQVLWNLIKNAIKFTPPGGQISISSELADDEHIRIAVEDTGIGIDPDLLPRIFDAFEQGERSITRQFGGLGLGLAISHGLILLHGGTLSVRSEGVGRGATFTLSLYLTADQSGSELLSEVPSLQSPVRARILLVEDHPDTAWALKRVLTRAGYDVHHAEDVRSAIEAFSNDSYQLVISDIGLPDGNGHDMMRRLSEYRIVPAIALSGFGMEEDRQRSVDAGFLTHVTKPVNAQTLLDTVNRVLETATHPTLIGDGAGEVSAP